jgi:uncharacterized protein (DUF2384 family)
MGLDGHRPKDLLRTPEGTQIVRDFLVGLAYCVYA